MAVGEKFISNVYCCFFLLFVIFEPLLMWMKTMFYSIWNLREILSPSLCRNWSVAFFIAYKYTLFHFRFSFVLNWFSCAIFGWTVFFYTEIRAKRNIIRIIIMHRVFEYATVAHCFHIYPHDDSIKCGFLPCWLFHYGWSSCAIQLL